MRSASRLNLNRYSLKLCIITLLVLINSLALIAQQKADSLSLPEARRLLMVMDSIHRVDSLQRVELLHEIGKLKNSDDKSIRRLLNRLDSIEQRDSLRRIQDQEKFNQLKATAKGHPVAPFEDTLFYVYTRIGSFSSSERAQAVSQKIQHIASQFDFIKDSVEVIPSVFGRDINYKDISITTISSTDAQMEGKNDSILARERVQVIVKAIEEERELKSIKTLLIRIGLVILIIGGIYFLIKLINKLFLQVRRKVIMLQDNILKGIRFKGYQLLDSRRELAVALFAIKIFRLIIIGLMLYTTLPLIFSLFPWTAWLAKKLFSWVTTPLGNIFQGIIDYLPNLFTILVISVVTHYAIKAVHFFSDEIERGELKLPGFYPDWAKPTFNIVKFLLYAFMFVLIFPYLPGSDSPIFQGVSVFIGILFSLGSSSAIANIVAGLVITYMRPFKKGDRIKIGEVTGDVIEKNMLVTRVRTIKNEEITIPNASILSGHTINYSTSATDLGLIINSKITIGYDAPWKKVHELLIEAALHTNGILKDGDKKPFVLQTSLDDFFVSYQINAYTDQASKTAVIYSELHQNIQDKFNEAGIEIMSPHYRAVREGNTPAMPTGDVSKEYRESSLKISTDEKDNDLNA